MDPLPQGILRAGRECDLLWQDYQLVLGEAGHQAGLVHDVVRMA